MEEFMRKIIANRSKCRILKPLKKNNPDYILGCLCPTCLSKDRDLYVLNQRQRDLLLLLGIAKKICYICWECYATIKNIFRFKDTAFRAQKLLETEAVFQRGLNTIGSLSRLKKTTVSVSFNNDEEDPQTSVFIKRQSDVQTRSEETKSVKQQECATWLTDKHTITARTRKSVNSGSELSNHVNHKKESNKPTSKINKTCVTTQEKPIENTIINSENVEVIDITEEETDAPFDDAIVSDSDDDFLEDSVIEKSDGNLDSSDTKKFERALLFNNVEIPKTVNKAFVDVAVDNIYATLERMDTKEGETEPNFDYVIAYVSDDDLFEDSEIERSDVTLDDIAKTADTLKNSVTDKNDATLVVSDITKLETASPHNNVDVSTTAEALEDSVIDKNDKILEVSDTTKPEEASTHNNVDVLPTADIFEDSVIDINYSTTVETTSPLHNFNVLKTNETLDDSVVNKNGATSEASNTSKLENGPPFNNVELLKTAEALKDSIIDKNDDTLRATDTSTVDTALPSDNVDFFKKAAALESSIIEKTHTKLLIDDTILETSNTTKVEKVAPQLDIINVSKIAEALEDSAIDKNDATLDASNIELEKVLSLNNVYVLQIAEPVEDSVIRHNYATLERTAQTFNSYNVSKSSKSLLKDSAIFKSLLPRLETSDSELTSLNSVKDSKPAIIQLEDSIIANQNVRTIELRDATKPEIESLLNYRKKPETGKVPLEESEVINQNCTWLRKNDIATLETKIRKRKNTKNKRSLLNFKLAKTTETEDPEIEILSTTLNKLALNGKNEKVTSNIANVKMTDTVIDNPEVGFVEAPESSEVITKILPVTKNVIDELQDMSIETVSGVRNKNCELYDSPEILLCTEEFNDCLEDDNIENTIFPSIDVRRDDYIKYMSTWNYEENSTNAIKTQIDNKKDPFKTIVRKVFAVPSIISQTNKSTKLNNKNTNFKIHDEKLKGTRELKINRVTADIPAQEKMPKRNMNKQPQQITCAYYYVENVFQYDVSTLETLKHVLMDHSYFKRAASERRRTRKNITLLKKISKQKTPKPNNSGTTSKKNCINKKPKTINGTKMAGVEKNVKIKNDWEQQQINFSNFLHDDSSSSRRESFATKVAKRKSNASVSNIENTQANTYKDITLITDIKVEKYIPETIEKYRECDDDADWSVDNYCKVKMEEVDIEAELSLEDNTATDSASETDHLERTDRGRDNSTDSASETDYIERLHRGSPLTYDKSVPEDNDCSKLSYYDYLYKPLDLKYIAEPDNDCLQNVSSIAASDSDNITADFEMNNITVSFANSLHYPNPPTEGADPNSIIETIQSENQDSSTEDLLEPLYYTDWTDQTYDHQYQNVTVLPKNKKKSPDPKKTELVVVKKEKIDEQPKDKQCGKRNKKKRPHPSQKKNERNEDYKNKLRFISKRIKRHSEVTNETENESGTEKINYEKLLLRPVVLLEKIDKVVQHCEANKIEDPPDMIARIKVEPTETEEITAFDQVKIKDEQTENEPYVFKTLKQEIIPNTDTKLLQSTNEAIEMKVNKADEPNSIKKVSNTMHTLRTFQGLDDLKTLREKIKQGNKFQKSIHKCESCIRTFSSEHGFKRHFNFSHAEVIGEHKCHVCECRFKSENKLKSHIHTHTRCYKCRWCPEEYLHQDDVKEHVGICHPGKYAERVRDRTYTCELCSKEYRNYVSMYLHRRSTHAYKATRSKAKLIQNKLNITNNPSVTNLSLAENNETSTEIDQRVAANNSSGTENCSSLTENSLCSTENKLSFTEHLGSNENNLSLTESSLSSMENKLSSTENKLSITENNLSSTENNFSLTENNVSSTENKLSSTENKLSSTENILSTTENKLSSTENNLGTTDNDSSFTDKKLSAMENDSSFKDNTANTCPVCNMDIWTSFACTSHCGTRSKTKTKW